MKHLVIAVLSIFIISSCQNPMEIVDTPSIHFIALSDRNISLTHLATNGGIYVATDSSGNIYPSTDGNNWGSVFSSSTPNPVNIVYGNNIFVCAFSGSGVTWSSDGYNWNPVQTLGLGSISDIAFGNGVFIAVQTSGDFYISNDGENWVEVPKPIGFTSSIQSIDFINNQFIALSNDGHVLTTADGQNALTIVSKPDYRILTKIAYGKGEYLVIINGGYGYYLSSDLINWEITSFPIPYSDLIFSEGRFIAVGSNHIAYSSDGIDWDYLSVASGITFSSICWDGSSYCICY